MKALIWTGDEAKAVASRLVPHLRDDYLLIRIVSVALNPTDSKAIIQKRAAKDGLLGCDFAGVVIEVGQAVVKSWAIGDRRSCIRCAHGANSNNAEDGSFAEIITAKGDTCMKIPSHVRSFDGAATIAVSALTCGQGLFQEMKLRLPTVGGEAAMLNESILIHGGSSSAGMLAIQYCKL